MFTTGDLIVVSALMLPALVVLADIKFHFTARLAQRLEPTLKREDLLFPALALGSVVVVVACGMSGKLNHFLAIVDYADVNVALFRLRILQSFFGAYLVMGVIFSATCAVLAARRQRGVLRWFLYGAFMNVFAFAFLLHVTRPCVKAEG